jgi:hypothetical protein
MKCKHCEEDIIFNEKLQSWYHRYSRSSACELNAEPLIEYVTPTEGPELPEVEVRQDDEEDWEEAELLFVDTKHKYHPAYFARRLEDRYIDYFKYCRTKESKDGMFQMLLNDGIVLDGEVHLKVDGKVAVRITGVG